MELVISDLVVGMKTSGLQAASSLTDCRSYPERLLAGRTIAAGEPSPFV